MMPSPGHTGVDTLARTEYRHSLGRIDVHQKDGIAMVFLRLFAEAFGLAINDRPKLAAAQHQDFDEFAVKLEASGQSGFNPGSNLGSGLVRGQQNVATGNVCRHLGEAQVFQASLQARHGYDVLAAHIDAAQKH
jgi:hypothetical protein